VRENRELRNQLLLANARLNRLQTAALTTRSCGTAGVAERSGWTCSWRRSSISTWIPVRQRLVLDAGSREGVKVGQAVIDAGGLMGQVIAVTPMQPRCCC
jgi:rod shape-determining protein MreC